ncbi:MAG: hypothetical protein ACI8TX_003419 [Hyphomicrobiaceae bacterium]|jgi:hypothetical protein
MTARINKFLLACTAIALCSLFATSAQAQVLVGFLEQTSPTPTVYVQATLPVADPAPAGMDFSLTADVLTAALGDVTALLQLVPGNGDVGDFGGFIAGNIALIDRGAIAFAAKVQNAEANGAVGVLIANTTPSSAGGLLLMGGDFSATNIPVLMIRNGLGQDLKDQLVLGDVTMHMSVIPEPSSLMLVLLAGVGLVSRRRR